MQNQKNTRFVFMLAGGMDSLLGAVALLLYFGLLPFDMSDWDVPRWAVGFIGGLLFFSGIAVFTYFSTKSEASE
jgi:protein-S-isoprenylcysteine O-methyltransferase Ste14